MNVTRSLTAANMERIEYSPVPVVGASRISHSTSNFPLQPRTHFPSSMLQNCIRLFTSCNADSRPAASLWYALHCKDFVGLWPRSSYSTFPTLPSGSAVIIHVQSIAHTKAKTLRYIHHQPCKGVFVEYQIL
jgi:hypothetical protein